MGSIEKKKLLVSCMDKQLIGPNPLIGSNALPLDNIPENEDYLVDLPLYFNSEDKSQSMGSVLISLLWQPFSGKDSEQMETKETIDSTEAQGIEQLQISESKETHEKAAEKNVEVKGAFTMPSSATGTLKVNIKNASDLPCPARVKINPYCKVYLKDSASKSSRYTHY